MYFDARGAAESSRLLFTLAGVPFEDKRFSVDFSQSGDNRAPEFAAGKKEGVFSANLGRVPVLYVGDDRDSIGDSKAIERYLAGKFDLAGGSELERAQIDGLVEHTQDLKEKYKTAKKEADGKGLSEFYSGVFREFAEKIEARVASIDGDGSPLVGPTWTIADVKFYVFFVEFFSDQDEVQAALAGCPRILASIAGLREHPRVKPYLAARKSTPF